MSSSPPEELLDAARGFIRDATWTYATTMRPNHHWYVVVPKCQGRPGLMALCALVDHYGSKRTWHGYGPYVTLTIDEWSYWPIWPVMNRKPALYAGWDGDPIPPSRGSWLPTGWDRDMRGDEVLPF